MKQVTMESVKQRIAHIEDLNARGVGTKVQQQQFELSCLRELVAVTAQRDALVVENANILALMHEQSGCFNAAIAEGFHEAVMQSGIENLIDVYQRRLQPAIQCIPPTPATSSAIAALRAEGVEMFGGWLRNSADIFDKNYRPDWADQDRVAADKAEEFARQLRESKGAQS